MINASSPTVRQKRFSESMKRVVSLVFRKSELVMNNSCVLCTRVVFSKDLCYADIFITSNLELVDNFEKSLYASFVSIDNKIIKEIIKDFCNKADTKNIPKLQFYIY